eukprot:355682-Chlamydomonas_euryale.AAC.5
MADTVRQRWLMGKRRVLGLGSASLVGRWPDVAVAAQRPDVAGVMRWTTGSTGRGHCQGAGQNLQKWKDRAWGLGFNFYAPAPRARLTCPKIEQVHYRVAPRLKLLVQSHQRQRVDAVDDVQAQAGPHLND